LKTVNIVRRQELVAELEAIGGDVVVVVVVDSPDVSEKIKAAVGQAELRLALDGVSGPAPTARTRPTPSLPMTVGSAGRNA
jgi:hypothetical protein